MPFIAPLHDVIGLDRGSITQYGSLDQSPSLAQLTRALHLPTFSNLHIQLRSIIQPSRYSLDLPYGQHPVDDASEDDVLVIEVVADGCCYEELAAVRVRSGVGH